MIKGFKKFCLCLLAAGAAGGILAGCNSPANRVLSSRQEYAEQMQAAVSSPFWRVSRNGCVYTGKDDKHE